LQKELIYINFEINFQCEEGIKKQQPLTITKLICTVPSTWLRAIARVHVVQRMNADTCFNNLTATKYVRYMHTKQNKTETNRSWSEYNPAVHRRESNQHGQSAASAHL